MKITKRQLRQIIRESLTEGSSYQVKDGVIRELEPGGYVTVVEPIGRGLMNGHVEDPFGNVIGYTGDVRIGDLSDVVDEIIQDHESMA